MSHVVFVYGTLKRGESNAYFMNEGWSEFIAEAETVDPFPLVVPPRQAVPFVLDASGSGKRIVGELFTVDDAMLRKLDEFEMHPDVYTRTKVSVKIISISAEGSSHELTAGQMIMANTYIVFDFRPDLIDLPHVANYHGKLYPADMKESRKLFYEIKRPCC